ETLSSLSLIGNADQTPALFDVPCSSNTSALKGLLNVSMETSDNEKLRCKIMLGISADGRS
ncbi:hypothetical protein JRQ81_015686, partial [Phrynocephalus forsythii]